MYKLLIAIKKQKHKKQKTTNFAPETKNSYLDKARNKALQAYFLAALALGTLSSCDQTANCDVEETEALMELVESMKENSDSLKAMNEKLQNKLQGDSTTVDFAE